MSLAERRQQWERKWQLGGADYVAKNRLHNALATVVPKLEALMADGGRLNAPTDNAPGPTGAELGNLSHRYLEQTAIAKP